MKGKVVQFRRGRHTIHERQFLIEVSGIDSKEKATKLVGKDVSWKSPAGREIRGKVASPHGNKGVLRCIFEKGLPGQAITTDVEVKG
ncbi:50S ribosomal protein L35ae [Candidatus Pacearchaeota archaeon CG10_big_fil_rev_8_21_14_0_10_32_14]|nr:MAG: 50S ribosomal protein L35ae [Candidatus Pacearchaeota archaeon CG10_big_fil_rev_8_21_14_0_10_32_14]